MSWTGPTSISNGSTRFTGRTFFITRAKPNANLRRAYSAPNDRTQGIVCSQTVALSGFYSHKHFPHHLCRVRFRGAQKCRAVEFTRRGKPVAVLVGRREYERLTKAQGASARHTGSLRMRSDLPGWGWDWVRARYSVMSGMKRPDARCGCSR